MNLFRLTAISLAAFLSVFNPAAAQWQTPTHSVPIGQGVGVVGFGSVAPGAAGLPFVSNGATADPTFQALPNSGLAQAPGNTIKCNPAGSSGAVQDCTLLQTGAGGLAASNAWTGANTWAGANTFNRNAIFGGGVPFVDVESGANGCAAALGNGTTNDQAAIQCQINFVQSTYNGGVVYFHPGKNYIIGSALTIKGGVVLLGGSRINTSITTSGDFTALAFDNTVFFAEIRDIFIVGSQLTTASQPTVTVAAGRAVNFTNCNVWGGSTAINTAGVDGTMFNCDIRSFGTGGVDITSSGANWYVRSKIDNVTSALAGFVQNASAVGLAENHFVDCDFSGPYTQSIIIADTTNTTAVTVIHGGVLSAPILIASAKATIIDGAEFGGAIVTNSTGPLLISASYAFGTTTVTGSGPRNCATGSNFNITC